MIRITDIMKNGNLVRNLNRQQFELDRVEAQLSTGQKIRNPSDDPSAATNQMFYRTRLNELGQFENNVGTARDRLNMIDGQLGRVTEIVQRIRELSVQASNGVYQGDKGFELRYAIGKEVDQHLRALIEIGNAKDSIGRSLFGGTVTDKEPFAVVTSNIPGLKGLELENQIVAVQYQGDNGRQISEIERDQYIDTSIPGNRAMWGTNTTLTASTDASGYVARTDQTIKVDGVEIRVSAGDRASEIIDKINNAGIEVKAASIGQDFVSLHTTAPHQIWLEDVESGTVLRDLGLINPDRPEPPNNYSETARYSGNSLFDVVLKLRNDLYSADQLEISGRDLGNLDEALDNVLRYRAETGARSNRMDQHEKRIAWDKTYTTELLNKSEGVDIPETIMNLKWLETVHNYALNAGSKIIRPTLMDFLR